MNWLHIYLVVIMFLSIVVSYAIFIIPVIFLIYIMYRVYQSITKKDIKQLNNGMFTMGASIFVIILTCLIHPFILQYFQVHFFSRAF